MSERINTRIEKIVITTALIAFLLSLAATLITYFRSDKINFMSLIAGSVIPLLAIVIVKTKGKSKS